MKEPRLPLTALFALMGSLTFGCASEENQTPGAGTAGQGGAGGAGQASGGNGQGGAGDAGNGSSSVLDVQIPWDTFLARQDMVWTSLPTEWKSGAWIGNGLLGGMFYQNPDGKSVVLEIGRGDSYDHQQGEWFDTHTRLLVGKMHLDTVGSITGGDVRLDVLNAEVRANVQTSQGTLALRLLSVATEPLIIAEVTATGGEAATGWRFEATPAISPFYLITGVTPVEHNPAPVTGTEGTIQFHDQLLTAGGELTTAYSVETAGAGAGWLALSIGYSYPEQTAKASAIGAVQAAKTAGVAGLVDEHRAFWRSYYPESFVSIPDAKLESYYWLLTHRIGSAMRSDGPISDLLGPWSTPLIFPRMWWNMNAQVMYSPVYTANRLDAGLSLTNHLDRHREQLGKNTGVAGGANIARSTGDLLIGGGDPEQGNLLFILHNYWQQYRYSMDETMLRERLFPLLKAAMRTVRQAYMYTGSYGKLHFLPGVSPEYKENKPNPFPTNTYADTNYIYSLARWGLQALLEANTRLKLADPDAALWQQTLDNLAPQPIDETGLMVGAGEPYSSPHRHWSHLLDIWPLYTLNVDQTENRQMLRTSVDHFVATNPSEVFVYTAGGVSAMYSALGQGDLALEHLERAMKLPATVITGNTFYIENGNPLQESAYMLMTATQHMLLQSFGGTIRVFPALPSGWQDVSFHRLRADGAFLVSAVRRSGTTEFVLVESLAGEPCRIKTNLAKPIVAEGNRAFTITVDGDVVSVDLAAGEKVLFKTEGTSPELTMAPVAAAGSPNAWGQRNPYLP
jgi:hypothetical protein